MKKMTKAMLMTALILGSVSMGTAVEASELHEFTLDPMAYMHQPLLLYRYVDRVYVHNLF